MGSSIRSRGLRTSLHQHRKRRDQSESEQINTGLLEMSQTQTGNGVRLKKDLC